MRRTLFVAMLIAMTAILLPSQEQLAYKDGNQLLQMCELGTVADKSHLSGDQLSDYTFCAGYVAAAMDAKNIFLNSMRAANKEGKLTPIYCLPQNGILIGQAVRVTVKWLRDHPE